MRIAIAADGGTLRKERLSRRDTAKLVGKQVLGRLCFYRLTRKPVLIFSTRRSGSTLLMRMIHSQPRTDYIDEPLNLWRLHPHFQRLPHPPYGKFISLDEPDELKLCTYFASLLSGKLRLRHRGNLLDSSRSFLANRLAVKNINANAMIDCFAKHFDVDVVYLIRHPVPIALSLIGRAWGSSPQAYLENERFRGDHLGPELARFGWRVLEHGTTLQQYALEWCLENLQPLRVFRQRPWLTLTYEEIIARPNETSNLICSRLGLPDPRRMRNVVLEASRTTSQQSRRVIREEGPDALVDKWMRELDPSDVAMAGQVLDEFNVQAYNVLGPWPHAELCHFGPLGGE